MPTVTAGLMQAEVDMRIVQAVQIAVARDLVGTLVWLFHRGRNAAGRDDSELASLEAGALLVTPYAFIYDMPMVTHAAIWAAERGAPDAGPGEFSRWVRRWRPTLLPMFMVGGVSRGGPVGAAVLLALFVVIVGAALKDGRSSPDRQAQPSRT